jgi:hypothetical protein
VKIKKYHILSAKYVGTNEWQLLTSLAHFSKISLVIIKDLSKCFRIVADIFTP